MFDDEGNYVVLPDPDTLPEPGYEGLTWEGIVDRIHWEHQEKIADWMEFINWMENQSGRGF